MDDTAVVAVRHRVNVDAYYRMAEVGVFAEDERVELIDGDIIDMAPIGQDHEGIVCGLTEALFLACAGQANLWVQNSIRLGGWSAPQPDLVVLRRRPDFYRTGARPGPVDVLLLVEVADSSLKYDRTVKLPLYAKAGIAEFWIVDVERNVVEVYREPSGDLYAETTTHRFGDKVALALAPDIVVTLAPGLA